MKACCLAVIFVLCVAFRIGATDQKYAEVEIAQIKATPEEYKNKKITYTSRYNKYQTTFPAYIENSGFKPGKYYLLEISPMNLPVMVKKSDKMNELIPTLAKNKVVKVSGKIEKFKTEPQRKMLPRYYLSLDEIEVVEADIKDSVPDDNEEVDWNDGGKDGDQVKKHQKKPKFESEK